MTTSREERLLERIRELPIVHKKASYVVYIKDRKGNQIDIQRVKARSAEKAKLFGFYMSKYVFRYRKAFDAKVIANPMANPKSYEPIQPQPQKTIFE